MIERFRDQGVGASTVDGPKYLNWTGGAEVTPASTWCIDGFIEAGASVSLVGQAKVGKSLFALEAAAAKASGAEFLGVELEPSPVLYLDRENRPGTIRERLAAMAFDVRDLELLKYASFPTMPTLDTPAGAAAALRLVQSTDARLVVLDTLQRFLGGEENSSQGIQGMYREFYVPLRQMGVAVLRLDHTGKDPARGARGSSAKVDDVDAAWRLSGRAEALQLTRTHDRSARGPGGLLLQRRSEPLRHEVTGEMSPDDARLEAEALTAEELTELLDDGGVPDTVGRPTASDFLHGRGFVFNTQALADAVRARKNRAS